MAGPMIPDNLEPYAGNGGGPQSGSQSLSTKAHPMPDEDLAPYGTHATMANGDHELTEGQNPGNTLGDRQRGRPNDHTRASAAGKPARDRGPMAPPQDEHTVPGVDGARPGYDGPEPVWRRKGSTTQRP